MALLELDIGNCSRRTNWYAAQLKPNGLSMAQRNLDRQGFRHFTPMRRVSATTPRGAKTKMAPLFPGYVFVRFDAGASRWQAINSTRGITRLLVDDPRNPSSLPDDFILGLMARCDENGLVSAPTNLAVGDKVRVLSGPFADIVTHIEAFGKDECLRLLMDLMGQKVRVDMPATSVEKLPRD